MLISKEEKLYRLKQKREKLLILVDDPSITEDEYLESYWELEDTEVEIMDIENAA